MNDEQINKAAFTGNLDITLPSGSKLNIRLLPVRMFNEFSEALNDESKLVEMYTGATAAEVDALPIQDFEAILETGGELNFPPFSRWVIRQRMMAKKMTEIFAAE